MIPSSIIRIWLKSKMPKILTPKYLGVLLFGYNNLQVRNQKKYNNFKRPQFKLFHTKLQWNLYQIYLRILTFAINLKNQTHHYSYSRHLYLSIQANYFSKIGYLYYRIYRINIIKLHIELNIEIKISIDAITISRLLLFL